MFAKPSSVDRAISGFLRKGISGPETSSNLPSGFINVYDLLLFNHMGVMGHMRFFTPPSFDLRVARCCSGREGH
jgi:hypothetical protein